MGVEKSDAKEAKKKYKEKDAVKIWNKKGRSVKGSVPDQRKKVQKKPQNSRNQYFTYYFCLMIEVSEAWMRIHTSD